MKRRARGQAVVELAVGLAAFTGLLFLGIHFAEVSFLSLKVQEAANYGLWHTSARRIHNFANPNNPYAGAAQLFASAGVEPTQRYQDFDGIDGTNGGQVRLVTTQASQIRVWCGPANGAINFSIRRAASVTPLESPFYNAQFQRVTQYYNGGFGGVACNAGAVAAAINMPDRTLFAQEGIIANSFNLRPMCGAGVGTCQGAYQMLVGDWALEGPRGSPLNSDAPHQLSGDSNRPYRQMVQQLYMDAMNRVPGQYAQAATEFARYMGGGAPPYDPRTFYMSYKSRDFAPTGNIEHRDVFRQDWFDDHSWNTGGTYKGIYRRRCFLGQSAPGIAGCG